MTREEAIGCLKNHHMWTGKPQEIVDVRTENKAMQMAIRSLEAWDEIIKHLEATAKELLDRNDEKQSHAFAKGITFSVSMIKNHMKEVKESSGAENGKVCCNCRHCIRERDEERRKQWMS